MEPHVEVRRRRSGIRGNPWLLLGGLALLLAPFLVSPQVPAGDSLPPSLLGPAGGVEEESARVQRAARLPPTSPCAPLAWEIETVDSAPSTEGVLSGPGR